MCGIIITSNKDDIKTHLAYQEDRGLDSLGIVNKECIYRAVKLKIQDYNTYIDNIDNVDSIHLIHHRKATVGDINIDNAHPFVGENFILIQNGTVKDFHKETDFDKSVDSHNLLLYIEQTAKDIKEIPIVLQKFKEEFKEDYGILILADFKGNVILVSDGARESFIKIEDNKIKLIRNYRENLKEGYKNIGHIIFTFEGNVIEQSFETELNSVDFKKKVVTRDYYQSNFPLVKNEEKKKKEEKEGGEDYYNKDDIKWEIQSYLWENYEILEYYNQSIMLTDFLQDKYRVEDTTGFYMTYKKGFPLSYFNDKFNEVKEEAENILYNKKRKGK